MREGSIYVPVILALMFVQPASICGVTPQTSDVILKGPWVDVRAYQGDLAAAVTESHGKRVIVSSSTVTFRSSLSVPSDVQIEVTQGGLINIGAADLSIDGPFNAGLHQVFSGKGTVSFGRGSVKEVYPEWWGAKGDGATDSSAAIQAAERSVVASRGVVRFGPGTYIGNFIVDSYITIAGSGVEQTILKSRAGSGLDVVHGRDFVKLAGTAKHTPENRGVNFLKMHDLTIDGNRANNRSGFGIRVWGKAMIWNNITSRNCAEDGIYTEFTEIDPPAAPNEYLQALNGYFTNIETMGNGGNGWTFAGPHDSRIINYDTFKNDGWGLESIYDSVNRRNGTLGQSNQWNSWNNARGSYKFGASASVTGITASGTGTGIELAPTVGNCQLNNAIVGGNTGVAGLILRGGENIITGSFSDNTGDAIRIDGAYAYVINVNGSGNRGSFLNFINDQGGTVNAYVNIPAGGTTTVGKIGTATSVNITGVGAGSVQRLFKLQSGDITTWNGFTHAIPSNNYPFATTNHTALPTQYTAGASPWTYQNSTGFDVDMAISGGSVSSIQFSRDGISYFDTGITHGIVHLSPNDYIRIVHTKAPKYTLIAR